MPDPFDPTAVDWGRLFAEAVLLATTARASDAEDVVTAGMTLLLEGAAPFDPSGDVGLAQHVADVGLRATRSRERTERRRRRPDRAAKLAHYLDEAPPTPEELTEERARKTRALEALRAAAADDPEVTAIVDLVERGVDEPAEQREQLGWPMDRLRQARQRLTRRVRAASSRADEGEEDEGPP